MIDRELLELAAKAAGDIEILGYHLQKGLQIDTGALRWVQYWNPLTDDGDALRLAVKLSVRIYIYDAPDSFSVCATDEVSSHQPHKDDPYAATRRAIVRAAAELGKEST